MGVEEEEEEEEGIVAMEVEAVEQEVCAAALELLDEVISGACLNSDCLTQILI